VTRRSTPHHADEPENRRVKRLVEMGDAIVGSVDGQAALNEVVGPNRQEIRFARK
jgi:hypothetical protein